MHTLIIGAQGVGKITVCGFAAEKEDKLYRETGDNLNRQMEGA